MSILFYDSMMMKHMFCVLDEMTWDLVVGYKTKKYNIFIQ